MQNVTIKHIARMADVSTPTVSRVLNNRPDVAHATRLRVQECIKLLGYQPSAIASGLASKRTYTLGLITADFSDYFFTQVIAGAEAEARRQGYFFMLGNTERNPEDELAYVRLFAERHTEGMLFARPNTEVDSHHLAELLRDGVPIVTTADYLPGLALTVVDVNNVDGAQQATRHLLEAGHRSVAMITGPSSSTSVQYRSRGYKLALQAAGLAPNAGLLVEGNWSYESGYHAMQALLYRATYFSAVFVQSDQMAIGSIRALRDAGHQVPGDVSVVGFDDIPGAQYAEPPLTTIRQPMREVGELAARLLIESIEQQLDPVRREVLLKTALIARASCRRVDETAQEDG